MVVPSLRYQIDYDIDEIIDLLSCPSVFYNIISSLSCGVVRTCNLLSALASKHSTAKRQSHRAGRGPSTRTPPKMQMTYRGAMTFLVEVSAGRGLCSRHYQQR